MALTVVDGGLLSPTNAQYTGYKNKLINGDFLVWQRGASITPALGSLTQYTSDRWACYQTGAATAIFQSGAFGSFQYCAAFNGVASNTEVTLFQCIESVNSYPLYGSQATFSVWVYATVSKTVNLYIDYANTANGFSSTTAVTQKAFSHPGNGWQQLVLTTSSVLPAGVQNGIRVRVNFPTCTTGTFAITGAQLEAGNTATTYDFRPYGTELTLCQRYYVRYTNVPYTAIFGGIMYNTVLFLGPYQFVTPMIYAPTLTYSAFSDFALIASGNGIQPTAISFDSASPSCARVNISIGTPLTAGDGAYMQAQNTNAWLAMSAEL